MKIHGGSTAQPGKAIVQATLGLEQIVKRLAIFVMEEEEGVKTLVHINV